MDLTICKFKKAARVDAAGFALWSLLEQPIQTEHCISDSRTEARGRTTFKHLLPPRGRISPASFRKFDRARDAYKFSPMRAEISCCACLATTSGLTNDCQRQELLISEWGECCWRVVERGFKLVQEIDHWQVVVARARPAGGICKLSDEQTPLPLRPPALASSMCIRARTCLIIFISILAGIYRYDFGKDKASRQR